MKAIIHQGHFGMEKYKLRARSALYWPNINQHLEDLVSNCSTCLDQRNRQCQEPLLKHEIPEAPWVKGH